MVSGAYRMLSPEVREGGGREGRRKGGRKEGGGKEGRREGGGRQEERGGRKEGKEGEGGRKGGELSSTRIHARTRQYELTLKYLLGLLSTFFLLLLRVLLLVAENGFGDSSPWDAVCVM